MLRKIIIMMDQTEKRNNNSKGNNMNTIIDSVTQGIIELYIQLKQRIRH